MLKGCPHLTSGRDVGLDKNKSETPSGLDAQSADMEAGVCQFSRAGRVGLLF